ncbi:hypothetical protein I3V23_12905 [Rhodobacterales bacterium HKCCA1288]|jgi:hypothetical protein|uniref:hypothetical protein n=1 Tax=Roseovarius sp. 10 TaxID=3080563 RepID=UPI0019385065|nr:hypothetical protein [Roseovarius sp. 10]MDV7200673.1 hypothetical protein [Roseovarius sp. 10]QPI85417.1 hypothetical protein I3V23_12905 [Rhodobacterales bacterium HKCCA1288]
MMGAVASIRAQWRNLGTIAAFAFAFIAVFAMASLIVRLAGVAVYAEYALYLTFGVAIRIIWHGIIGTVFARGFSIATAQGLGAHHLAYFGIGLFAPFAGLATIALTPVLLDAQIGFGEITLSPFGLFAGLMLGATISAAGAVVELANVMGRRRQAICAMLSPSVAQLMALASLKEIGLLTAPNLAALAAGLGFISLVAQFIFLRRAQGVAEAKPEGAGRLKSFLTEHSKTMLFWVPPSLMMRALDKWYAADHLSVEGFAAMAVLILMTQGAMQAGMSILSRVVLPKVYDLAADGQSPNRLRAAHQITRRFGYLILVAGGIWAVILAQWGSWLLARLFTDEIANHHLALIPFAIGATLMTYAGFQITHGHIAQNIKPFTKQRYGEAIAYAVGLVLFVPVYGVIGVGFAMGISGIISCILSFCARLEIFNSTLS